MLENHPGLDYAFLKYIGVSVDGEEALHSFYLPLLVGHTRVLDLGCGMGGFVKLLRQHGFDGYGVDSDPQCIAEARAHDLPVIEADVLAYLRTVEPGSLDAIFSAHMVEHMPYGVVLETIQLAHQALKPGGRLLLATPNPRALVAHLELYHLHFGHIALYHPRLLAFFMEHSGFAHTEWGENPHTMASRVAVDSPVRLLQNLATDPLPALTAPSSPTVEVASIPVAQLLPKPQGFLRRLVWQVKMPLVRWLVQPFFDRMLSELHRVNVETQAQFNTQATAQQAALQRQTEALHQQFTTALQALDRPFECYVIGDKAQ